MGQTKTLHSLGEPYSNQVIASHFPTNEPGNLSDRLGVVEQIGSSSASLDDRLPLDSDPDFVIPANTQLISVDTVLVTLVLLTKPGAIYADPRRDRAINPLASSVKRPSPKIWTCTVWLEVGRADGWMPFRPCKGSHQGAIATWTDTAIGRLYMKTSVIHLACGGRPAVREVEERQPHLCLLDLPTIRGPSRNSASSAPLVITVPLTKLQRTGVYPKGSIDTPRADRSRPGDPRI